MPRLPVLLLGLALLMLGACTQDSPFDQGTVLGRPREFQTAEAWIRALRQHGVSCKPLPKYHPDAPFTYADAGACRLNGPRSPIPSDLVTVFFVKNPRQVIADHFAGANAFRDIFLYRDNWLADAPINAPRVIKTIRQSFNATG
jgi:hypothetical protein